LSALRSEESNDLLTFNISVRGDPVWFNYGDSVDIPFHISAKLRTIRDVSYADHNPQDTSQPKPLKVDIMDITSKDTAVIKVSHQSKSTPTADQVGDWRVAVLQQDIAKYIILEDGSELRVTLVKIKNYSTEPSSQPPVVTLRIEDPGQIRRRLEDAAEEKRSTERSTRVDAPFRKSNKADKESAKKDLELKGYISAAFNGLQ
jgi:hypothetical protein